MNINNIVEKISQLCNNQNESFIDSTIKFSIDKNKYAKICSKTFKIVEDNLDIETKRFLYDELNRKIFEMKNDKLISEFRCLYTYLHNTNRLDWKIEKRERPDFRIYNQDIEEYVEITQDITQYESIALKCLNRYYYGDKHIDKSLKKYLNIRRFDKEIVVSPKSDMNIKKRKQNLFYLIYRKIEKYTSYINEMPEIIDGSKTILAKMRVPINIKEPDIVSVIKNINLMIKDTLVEKVVLITYDNRIIIINKD